MPTTMLFVVPCHGRAPLARICLTQLRRTCDALAEHGIEASAIVVADDENLETAEELGFGTVRRDNTFLSAKFNDGLQAACDPEFNPRPADYVIPCGSDDWVDHRILLNLPPPDTLLAFRWAAFVREDGRRIVSRRLGYEGGVGIRVYPRQLLEPTGYRPADEDRERACDTSILVNVRRAYEEAHGREPRISYGDVHEWQVVDWKSADEQLNPYGDIVMVHRRGTRPADPFVELAGTYPAEALAEMRAFYAGARQAVAA